MDIEVTTVPTADDDQWCRARMAANAWRGYCLDIFARSEASVSETLLVLANTSKGADVVKLPHLVGQRFEGLANLIGPTGAFSSEGKASAALSAFRVHESLRVSLCHGVGKVALDQRGGWLLVLRTLVFRSKQPQRTQLVVEENEAQEILTSLRTAGQRLGTELGQLRKAFSPI